MKFEVHISAREGAKCRPQTIKGFHSLDDACRVALALGPVHRANANVSVWIARKGVAVSSALLTVFCDGDDKRAIAWTERARMLMKEAAAKRKAGQERRKWLRAQDDKDETFSRRLFMIATRKDVTEAPRYANQEAVTAFFNHNFAEVERLMAAAH